MSILGRERVNMRNIHMWNYELNSAWVPKLITLSIIVDTIAMLEILSGEAIKEEVPISQKPLSFSLTNLACRPPLAPLYNN